MALHDVDPNTTNRIEPMPQASDQSPTRSSDGTTAITNKQDGSSGAYVSTKDATVKVNDGTDNRVALGLLPDGTYGMKVSQEGYDVLSAEDDELIFNSSQNVFKIAKIVSLTIPAYSVTVPAVAGQASTQSTLVNVLHELGYRPAFKAFIEDTSFTGSDGLPAYRDAAQIELPLFVGAPGGFATTATRVWVENEYVIARAITVVYVGGAGYGSTLNIPAKNLKVYLLQETAN